MEVIGIKQEQAIKRKAKLFETGSYPDKGVTVSEEDLDQLIASFGNPIPIQIEHTEQPLELGKVIRIWRDGKELFGEIEMSEEANALIEKSTAGHLSIALTKDLKRIVEVSLVRQPRVEDARIFSQTVTFHVELCPTNKLEAANEMTMSELQNKLQEALSRAETAEEKARAAETQVEFFTKQNLNELTNDKINQWLTNGKIAPASVGTAKALLQCGDLILFGEKQTPVFVLFEQFIDTQPKVVLFGETASSAGFDVQSELPPEEADFFKRHFPGLDTKTISKHRKGGF